MRRIIAILLAFCVLLSVSGCHGRKVEPAQDDAIENAYEIPDIFDTSRNYEITFWAKNDTNMTQVGIYQKNIRERYLNIIKKNNFIINKKS